MGPELELKAVKPAPMWRKVLAVIVFLLLLVGLGVAAKLLPWEFGVGFLCGVFCVLLWHRLTYGYWLDYR